MFFSSLFLRLRLCARLTATATLISVSAFAATVAPTSEPPKSWIDADTGHRVVRLTDESGSGSLYFTDNAWTPDGRQMIYTVGGAVRLLDITTFETRPLIPGPVRAIMVGRKTPTVYYTKTSQDRLHSALYALNITTGETRKIADLPRRGSITAINADESLAAGTFVEGDGADYGGTTAKSSPAAPRSLNEPANKPQMMEDRLAARLPMSMYTVDLKTGQTRTLIEHTTDWLNHLQFSPTDPTLLMYCHEGTWWKVDRIWTIRTDGTQNTLVHQRTMGLEAVGHEVWSPDGKTIWYDIRFPWGVDFFVGSYDATTKERAWYHVERDAWSIHYSQSNDLKLFCGDGGSGSVVEWATPANEWIYLFRPEQLSEDGTLGKNLVKPGVFHAERLVNLHAHKYSLEPNVTFSPDQKYVIFRSNVLGATYVFAVEVAKTR